MATVLIKIGCNESPDYEKYGSLYKHGDIVDVLPRKWVNGEWTEDYAPGVMEQKEFLCVKVDTAQMTDEEFEAFRQNLKQPLMVDSGQKDGDGKIILVEAKRRRYFLDVENSAFLSTKEKTDLASAAVAKESKQAIDVKSSQKISAPISEADFNVSVKDVLDLKSIDEKPVIDFYSVKAGLKDSLSGEPISQQDPIIKGSLDGNNSNIDNQ